MGKLPATRHVQHLGMQRNGISIDERDTRAIAASILHQAVDDWVYLIIYEDRKKLAGPSPTKKQRTALNNLKANRCGQSRRAEIRSFLRSEYGSMLCDIVGITSDAVLGKLEDWLRAYEDEGILPQPIYTGREVMRR